MDQVEIVDKPKPTKRLQGERRPGTVHFTVNDSDGVIYSSPFFHDCFTQMKKNPDSYIDHYWRVNSPDK